MKKLFLLGAIVCVLGMMAACKSGTASDIATTAEITWTTIEDKLANEIPLDENDCLFILTDTTLDEVSVTIYSISYAATQNPTSCSQTHKRTSPAKRVTRN